ADLAATKVRFVERKIAPLKLAISNDGGERLNLLLPQLESKNLSGECSAAFNLARRLAESGLRVRLVLVDAPGPNQSELRESISSAEGLEDLLDRVEVVDCHDRSVTLEAGRRDVFLATTWWTAHIAHNATLQLGNESFVYLIQEYE